MTFKQFRYEGLVLASDLTRPGQAGRRHYSACVGLPTTEG